MQTPFVKHGAREAVQFRRDREEAGLPVPTDAQVERAQRLVEGNPLMRGHHSPLGLQLLALRLPLSKRERRALELKPHRNRGEHLRVEADPEAVKAFVDANPHMDEREAAQAIGLMHGYTDVGPALRRVDRFTRQADDHRVCSHLRDKMLMLSAIAQGVELIRARPVAAEASA